MVSPEEFVEAWQAGSTVEGVATRLDMSKQSVGSRAFNYRKKGIPLKKFKRESRLNIEALTTLAKSLANGQESEPAEKTRRKKKEN